MNFGIDEMRVALTQALWDAPTRKIVRKEGKLHYMLEDEDGLPDPEEAKNYRALLRYERNHQQVSTKESYEEEIRMLEEEFTKKKKQ